MIDVSALNAYIIWGALKPTYFTAKANKRRQFLIALGKELAGIQQERQDLEPTLSSQLELPKKKRRCFLCRIERPKLFV